MMLMVDADGRDVVIERFWISKIAFAQMTNAVTAISYRNIER
jgi:hypothetical protein